MRKILTVDEALAILTEAKKQMGGKIALVLSLTDSEFDDVSVNGMTIHNDESNTYVEVQALHEGVNRSTLVLFGAKP